MTCRKTVASMVELGEESGGDGTEDSEGSIEPRAIARGRNGGIAERVAVERCWLALRRHDFRTPMSDSGSVIYIARVNDLVSNENCHVPLCHSQIQLGAL